MTGLELLGYSTGVVTIIGVAAKWIIKDWFKKAKEIQELKRMQTRASILSLQEITNNHSNDLKSHALKLIENTTNLKYVQEQTKTMVRKFEMAMNHNETLHRDIDKAVASIVKSEIVNLTNQLMLIKSKKNGK